MDAENDLNALAAVHALTQTRLSMPKALSVTDIGGFHAAVSPLRLSSIARRLFKAGAWAINLLLAVMCHPEASIDVGERRRIRDPRLILREGSGPAKTH